MLVNCQFCKTTVNRKPAHVKRHKNHYCSAKCRSLGQRSGEIQKCFICNKNTYKSKAIIKRDKLSFCSRSCSAKWNNTLRTKPDAKYNYRQRALKHYGKKCSSEKCPFNGDVIEAMLDVHHINGSRKNNLLKNLIVLCVWCHAKVTRNLDGDCSSIGRASGCDPEGNGIVARQSPQSLT